MSTFHPDPRRWWALVLIAVAQFLVIMDTSIIGVALPEIQEALGFSQAQLSWVFNAYVIAFGGLLLLGGRLSDIHGAAAHLRARLRHPRRRHRCSTGLAGSTRGRARRAGRSRALARRSSRPPR